MRSMKLAAVLAIFVVCVSVLCPWLGGTSTVCPMFDKGPSRTISKVGYVLLPKGKYKIEPTMEGTEHIMVFQQLRASHPATTRTKCQLVPVDKKAQFTEVF